MFSPELPLDRVLKIGRDFQNQDSWHGAHYDTARLLCDTIVRLSRKLKEKENVSRKDSEHEKSGLEHATEVC